MAYRLTKFGCVLRVDDSVTIPPDARNEDYQAYLAWRAAGGVPMDPLEDEPGGIEPAPPPEDPPPEEPGTP